MLPKYKDIIDLLEKGSITEAKEQILGLRESALELQEQNQELKQLVRALEDSIKTKSTVKWEKPSYWKYNGEEKDGPFCQRCFDVNEKLIRLQGGKNDSWTCRECNSLYRGSGYVTPNYNTSFRVI